MNYWSNIETSLKDPEIVEINKLEELLGVLSDDVWKVRELIRRVELCHFKYKEHLKHLNDAISNLRPTVQPSDIGQNHISKGGGVLHKDKTGRSVVGLQYLCSLKAWLSDRINENTIDDKKELNEQINNWLNGKSQDKERLVRLLISRLTWDWASYAQYQHGGKHEELEFQVCRMDICHYAFPGHLDLLIQAIGRLEPVENFHGCGSFDFEIRSYVEEQFLILCDDLKFCINKSVQGRNDQIKIWLNASLAKTLKEQSGIKISLPRLI